MTLYFKYILQNWNFSSFDIPLFLGWSNANCPIPKARLPRITWNLWPVQGKKPKENGPVHIEICKMRCEVCSGPAFAKIRIYGIWPNEHLIEIESCNPTNLRATCSLWSQSHSHDRSVLDSRQVGSAHQQNITLILLLLFTI